MTIQRTANAPLLEVRGLKVDATTDSVVTPILLGIDLTQNVGGIETLFVRGRLQAAERGRTRQTDDRTGGLLVDPGMPRQRLHE